MKISRKPSLAETEQVAAANGTPNDACHSGVNIQIYKPSGAGLGPGSELDCCPCDNRPGWFVTLLTWKCSVQRELQEQIRNKVRHVLPTRSKETGSNCRRMRMRTSSLRCSSPILVRPVPRCSGCSLLSAEPADNKAICSCSSLSQRPLRSAILLTAA